MYNHSLHMFDYLCPSLNREHDKIEKLFSGLCSDDLQQKLYISLHQADVS